VLQSFCIASAEEPPSTTESSTFEESAAATYLPPLVLQHYEHGLQLRLDMVDMPEPFSEVCIGLELLSLKHVRLLMLQAPA